MKELEDLKTMAEAAYNAAVESRGSWEAWDLYEEVKDDYDAALAAAKEVINETRELK